MDNLVARGVPRPNFGGGIGNHVQRAAGPRAGPGAGLLFSKASGPGPHEGPQVYIFGNFWSFFKHIFAK